MVASAATGPTVAESCRVINRSSGAAAHSGLSLHHLPRQLRIVSKRNISSINFGTSLHPGGSGLEHGLVVVDGLLAADTRVLVGLLSDALQRIQMRFHQNSEMVVSVLYLSPLR